MPFHNQFLRPKQTPARSPQVPQRAQSHSNVPTCPPLVATLRSHLNPQFGAHLTPRLPPPIPENNERKRTRLFQSPCATLAPNGHRVLSRRSRRSPVPHDASHFTPPGPKPRPRGFFWKLWDPFRSRSVDTSDTKSRKYLDILRRHSAWAHRLLKMATVSSARNPALRKQLEEFARSLDGYLADVAEEYIVFGETEGRWMVRRGDGEKLEKMAGMYDAAQKDLQWAIEIVELGKIGRAL